MLTQSHVLLLDDEETVRASLGAVIQHFGYVVTAVAGEDEAIAALSQQAFDVLISDLNLGHAGDGLSVVRRARRSKPAMPVIVITGYPTAVNAMEADGLRVFRYFTKPCDLHALESALREATSAP